MLMQSLFLCAVIHMQQSRSDSKVPCVMVMIPTLVIPCLLQAIASQPIIQPATQPYRYPVHARKYMAWILTMLTTWQVMATATTGHT